jgi:hypothetical protein
VFVVSNSPGQNGELENAVYLTGSGECSSRDQEENLLYSDCSETQTERIHSLLSGLLESLYTVVGPERWPVSHALGPNACRHSERKPQSRGIAYPRRDSADDRENSGCFEQEKFETGTVCRIRGTG